MIELLNLQKRFSSKLQLQFVALSPLEFWDTEKGKELAKKISTNQGILGGVVVPPFNKRKTIKLLSKMLLLADKYKYTYNLRFIYMYISLLYLFFLFHGILNYTNYIFFITDIRIVFSIFQ